MSERVPPVGAPLRLRDELALLAASLDRSGSDAVAAEPEPLVVPWPHEPRPSSER